MSDKSPEENNEKIKSNGSNFISFEILDQIGGTVALFVIILGVKWARIIALVFLITLLFRNLRNEDNRRTTSSFFRHKWTGVRYQLSRARLGQYKFKLLVSTISLFFLTRLGSNIFDFYLRPVILRVWRVTEDIISIATNPNSEYQSLAIGLCFADSRMKCNT
jgi:hypothetical protein